ncbi:MAG: C2H2-type zinc finger protein [Zetaproteobacteria bacterium]|nr:C2H2-type zinc finger protein [Zetaproteobacteria bacterium]
MLYVYLVFISICSGLLYAQNETPSRHTPISDVSRTICKQARLYPCKICARSFTRSGHLKYHVRAVHEQARPFVCEDCGQQFKNPAHFKSHAGYVHKQAQPFVCQDCKQRFRQYSQLKKHDCTVHGQVKPFVYDACGQGFVGSSSPEQHVDSVHQVFVPQVVTPPVVAPLADVSPNMDGVAHLPDADAIFDSFAFEPVRYAEEVDLDGFMEGILGFDHELVLEGDGNGVVQQDKGAFLDQVLSDEP